MEKEKSNISPLCMIRGSATENRGDDLAAVHEPMSVDAVIFHVIIRGDSLEGRYWRIASVE